MHTYSWTERKDGFIKCQTQQNQTIVSMLESGLNCAPKVYGSAIKRWRYNKESMLQSQRWESKSSAGPNAVVYIHPVTDRWVDEGRERADRRVNMLRHPTAPTSPSPSLRCTGDWPAFRRWAYKRTYGIRPAHSACDLQTKGIVLIWKTILQGLKELSINILIAELVQI